MESMHLILESDKKRAMSRMSRSELEAFHAVESLYHAMIQNPDFSCGDTGELDDEMKLVVETCSKVLAESKALWDRLSGCSNP